MDAGGRSVRLRRTLPDGYHCLIKPLIEFRRDRREAVFLSFTALRMSLLSISAPALQHAAELLRATATQSAAEKTEQAIIVPPVLDFPKSRREKNARQAVLSSRDLPQVKPLRISKPPANGSQRLSFTTKRRISRQKARLRCASWNSITVLWTDKIINSLEPP